MSTAKFYGKVGYGELVETAPGVFEEVITEQAYFGDVIRNARNLVSDDKVLSDIQASNSISIVADAYANNHFFSMRYVEWAGTRWIVDNVEVQSPACSFGWEEFIMGPRLALQALLSALCPNVYFQPPQNLTLKYPCIVYQRDDADTQFAGNLPYKYETRYQVTIIDRNPDSDIPLKVARLPKCVFNRFFVAENLNHDVYTLYFQEGTT